MELLEKINSCWSVQSFNEIQYVIGAQQTNIAVKNV